MTGHTFRHPRQLSLNNLQHQAVQPQQHKQEALSDHRAQAWLVVASRLLAPLCACCHASPSTGDPLQYLLEYACGRSAISSDSFINSLISHMVQHVRLELACGFVGRGSLQLLAWVRNSGSCERVCFRSSSALHTPSCTMQPSNELSRSTTSPMRLAPAKSHNQEASCAAKYQPAVICSIAARTSNTAAQLLEQSAHTKCQQRQQNSNHMPLPGTLHFFVMQ